MKDPTINKPAYKQNRRRYRQQFASVRPWFRTRDGVCVRVRVLTPSDHDLLIDLFNRLSPESRRRRFHTNVDHLEPKAIAIQAKQMADVDNRTIDGAVIALHEEKDGEAIIAVARLARPPDQPTSAAAEAAIVVRDDFQGRGVGLELLRRLVLLARDMGVSTLVAEIESENNDAIRLFRALNLPTETSAYRGTTTLHIQIPPTASPVCRQSSSS